MKTTEEYKEELKLLTEEREGLLKERRELNTYINRYNAQIYRIKNVLRYRDTEEYKDKQDKSPLKQMFGNVRYRDLTPEQKREYNRVLQQKSRMG